MTKETKPTASITKESKPLTYTTDDMTWNEATDTWDEATYTWDTAINSSASIFAKESKPSNSVTKEIKP